MSKVKSTKKQEPVLSDVDLSEEEVPKTKKVQQTNRERIALGNERSWIQNTMNT